MNDQAQQHAILMFLSGQSVSEISAYYGVHRSRIESLIRDTTRRLVELDHQHRSHAHAKVVTDPNGIGTVIGLGIIQAQEECEIV